MAGDQSTNAEFDQAITLAGAEVDRLRQAQPADDLQLAMALIKLAQQLKKKEERESSEACFREALKLRRRALTRYDPGIAVVLTHLGRLVEESGRFAEAEPLYREALDIFRASLPSGHPHLILSLRNLAAVLEELGRAHDSETESLFREALMLTRATEPVDDLNLAECISDLGAHLADRGLLEEGDALLTEALAIHRRLRTGDGTDLANILVRTARLRHGQLRFAEAELAAREAVSLRARIHPATDFRLAKAMSLLGMTLTALARFDEAEVCLTTAYQTLHSCRGTLGAGPSRIRDTIARLVQLYEAWGKDDQAAIWRGGLAVQV